MVRKLLATPSLLLIFFGIWNCILSLLLVSNKTIFIFLGGSKLVGQSLTVLIIGYLIGGLTAFIIPTLINCFASFLLWIASALNGVSVEFKDIFTCAINAYLIIILFQSLKVALLLLELPIFALTEIFVTSNSIITSLLQTLEISSLLYLFAIVYQLKEKKFSLFVTTLVLEFILNLVINLV